MRDAQSAAEATARWRQVNHPVQDSDDLPLLYAAVRLSDRPDPHARGCIVAFGRDLRAMVALQRRLELGPGGREAPNVADRLLAAGARRR